MPCTVPVPKDYAQKYDEGKQSTYGQHQVFTGPYMIENDGKGNDHRLRAEQAAVLVRNPSWDKNTDFKPAYFDRIVETCCSDATVAARKTLSGQGYLSGDYAAPPVAVLKQALSSRKDQISVEPSGGNRYISLNTTVKPLDNVNVRRAISAVIDRNALRQTRGGPTLGTTATHFLPPGIAGFEEAGGEEGPGLRLRVEPDGERRAREGVHEEGGLRERHVRRAAAADGRRQRVAGEGDGGGVPGAGRQDRPQAAATARCRTRRCELEVLPGAEVEHGDLPEPRLGRATSSPRRASSTRCSTARTSCRAGNVNTAEVNDPKLNAQIDKAKQITDPAEAAQGLGRPRQGGHQPGLLHPVAVGQQHRPRSRTNMNGVSSKFNSGACDFAFSSFK